MSDPKRSDLTRRGLASDPPAAGVSRRTALALGAGAAIVLVSPSARATPAEMEKSIKEFTKGAAIADAGVQVDIPILLESGNSVPMTVLVESAMPPQENVRRIAVFNERNPQPNVAIFEFTPRSGRAVASTRIRLGDSQKVVAIAEMNDGTFRRGAIDVIVTLPACAEDS
ncbi:MAG TPA: thiosulfate oxidation carrier protein SoxY [Beijerinckiaceae bacterium]